jgi:hypothetical protein
MDVTWAFGPLLFLPMARFPLNRKRFACTRINHIRVEHRYDDTFSLLYFAKTQCGKPQQFRPIAIMTAL